MMAVVKSFTPVLYLLAAVGLPLMLVFNFLYKTGQRIFI